MCLWALEYAGREGRRLTLTAFPGLARVYMERSPVPLVDDGRTAWVLVRLAAEPDNHIAAESGPSERHDHD
ncbi:hypothetical protein G5V59_27470 [Nocardioides sp. W3-2-3]|uniref:hypothetical protein n=1 Tax=Nocardioides convexus TaxID=2712224 RepID=UPI00241836A3|nr:hypothetical protein [Nocardioides convexus]NHA02123.1 hypothetical protein [Nocardioides convexus]